MPAAFVVGGAEYGAAGARCGGEERDAAAGGAADGAGASDEAGDLPRARPAIADGEEGGAGSYEAKLRRALERHFPGFAISRLTSGVDLEKSFGPIYARGVLRQGQSAFAVLGVNASETQASIDAALTFGILWLDVCREIPTLRSKTAEAGVGHPSRGVASKG